MILLFIFLSLIVLLSFWRESVLFLVFWLALFFVHFFGSPQAMVLDGFFFFFFCLCWLAAWLFIIIIMFILFIHFCVDEKCILISSSSLQALSFFFFLKKQSKLINKKINKIGPVTVNGKNHGFIKYHYLE